jgi:hypothetical protein
MARSGREYRDRDQRRKFDRDRKYGSRTTSVQLDRKAQRQERRDFRSFKVA